jgi:hypothetical protein
MAWFRSEYQCYRCNCEWEDEWSAGCDDDCPACGARHISASKSDDLTTVIDREGDCFVVCYSPENASDAPEYVAVGRFLSSDLAEQFATVYAPGQIALSV